MMTCGWLAVAHFLLPPTHLVCFFTKSVFHLRLLTNTFDLIMGSTREEAMGYVLRIRLASFFAGAATALAVGLYVLHKDYKVAHEAISQQVKGLYESLDKRISALEKLKEAEAPKHVEAPE